MPQAAVLDRDLHGRIGPSHRGAKEGNQAGKDANASELLARASLGDQLAWDTLVDRHGRLVWAVARAHGLNLHDAADASHVTWLLLAQHLGSLPQPERLGEWLAATARRESRRIRALRGLDVEADQPHLEPRRHQPPVAVGWLATEREAEPSHTVASLPGRCQPLLRLLMVEPPLSDAELAAALGMPIDGVGQARTWCLGCLRPGTTAAGRSEDATGEAEHQAAITQDVSGTTGAQDTPHPPVDPTTVNLVPRLVHFLGRGLSVTRDATILTIRFGDAWLLVPDSTVGLCRGLQRRGRRRPQTGLLADTATDSTGDGPFVNGGGTRHAP
jgi:DNA-directed RNA polymerase specialized sigma24 family protein